jgi:hypothetical protein
MLIIRSSITVTVPIPANPGTNQAINFPSNVFQLTNKPITGIDVITSTQQAYAADSTPVISPSQCAYVLLKLVNYQNQDRLLQLPTVTAISGSNYGFIRELYPEPVQLEKCQITILTNSSLFTTASCLIFNFYYNDWEYNSPKQQQHR